MGSGRGQTGRNEQDMKFYTYMFLNVFLAAFLAMPSFAAPEAESSSPLPSLRPRYKFSITRFYKDALKNPIGIFMDNANEEFYVADRDRSEIFVFNTDGSPVFRFGDRETLSGINDLVVRDDLIYISREGRPFIDVLNLRGVFQRRLDPGIVDFKPGKMDIDEAGNIYVVNKKLGNCVVIDSNEEFVLTIGGGLKSLSGVSAGGGFVYFVSPFYGRIIHVFNDRGEHIMNFEGLEGQGGTLGLPVGIKVDGAGNIWIADTIKGIVIYDKNGKKTGSFGYSGPFYQRLKLPVEIDLSNSGMIYLIDKGNKRISVFK